MNKSSILILMAVSLRPYMVKRVLVFGACSLVRISHNAMIHKTALETAASTVQLHSDATLSTTVKTGAWDS